MTPFKQMTKLWIFVSCHYNRNQTRHHPPGTLMYQCKFELLPSNALAWPYITTPRRLLLNPISFLFLNFRVQEKNRKKYDCEKKRTAAVSNQRALDCAPLDFLLSQWLVTTSQLIRLSGPYMGRDQDTHKAHIVRHSDVFTLLAYLWKTARLILK